MQETGQDEGPTAVGKVANDEPGPSPNAASSDGQEEISMLRESKGFALLFVAAGMEAIGTYLPLYSSRHNPFTVLDYQIISGFAAPLFVCNAMFLLLLSLIQLTESIQMVRRGFTLPCSGDKPSRCCKISCCSYITCAVFSFIVAVGFIALFPSVMPIVFGGPNQLGNDLKYDLGSGYFLTLFGKLMTAGGFCVCYYEQRRKSSRARNGDVPYRPISVKICMAAQVLAIIVSITWISFLLAYVYSKGCPGVDVSKISLPAGFAISKFADVAGARSIAKADKNYIVVSTRKVGKVYAIKLDSRKVSTIFTASDGAEPNGIAYHDGFLYIVEISRVLRFAWTDVLSSVDSGNPLKAGDGTKIADYPTEKHHGWRYARFGPDGLLYIAVGAPCNICYEKDFATITSLNVSTYEKKVVARGVRNSVGFDFHHTTGNLWFTDNGGDWLGDDLPPDELNEIKDMKASPPRHFGFPHCYGKSGVSYGEKYNPTGECASYLGASVDLGPHVAALGMRFYPSNLPAGSSSLFPSKYHGKIFIAERGSWNRRDPIGYRVTMSDGASYGLFASGWLHGNGAACGRPVDLEILSDGSMIISDDKDGKLYQVTYSK